MRLRYFFFGVLITFACAIIGHRGDRYNWEREAYEHCAAMYKVNLVTGKTEWKWLDDYFVEELRKARSTPKPIIERL